MKKARTMSLDKRLSAVASLFPVCGLGVDIGADHGKLAAWLLQTNRCDRMIVSDISAISVRKLNNLMRELDLVERCLVKEADGFDAIDQPVDAVAICGMGGKTIAEMIQKRPILPGNPVLILSAHTQIPLLRETLVTHGYAIEKEVITRASGRFYNIIKAKPGNESYTRKQIQVGFHVEGNDAQMLRDFYQWLLDVEAEKQTDNEDKLMWIKEELERCDKLL